MKTSLERLPKSRVRLSVTVPKEAVQKAIHEAYERLGEQVEVKGFRKGQAPKRMIFDSVGVARLRETVLERLLPNTYFQALQEAKIVPVEGPHVKIDSADWEKDLPEAKAGAGISFQAEVDVLPKVELAKDYKKLRIANRESRIAEVTEEEVNSTIDHLRRQQAQFKDLHRDAQEGDRLEIEFAGKVGGVVREEFSSKNYPLILGQQTFLPDFEKHLTGMKKGDKKSFRLDISKKDGQGKDAVDFSVTLLDLKEVLLPELTDEFAKKVGQDSVLALRGALRQSLRANRQERYRREREQQVADQLLGLATLEVPESLIHQEIHRMMDSLRAQATQYGMPWEAYLTQIKRGEDDLHKDLEQQAEKTVKFGLILGHIMTKEGIDPKAEQAGRQAMDRLLEYATRN